MTRLRRVNKSGGALYGYSFECPGCKELHVVPVGPDGWEFNGDLERPTFAPSLLSNRDHGNPAMPLCHSFIRNGRIEFLGDCTHELAGQTVDLPEIDE